MIRGGLLSGRQMRSPVPLHMASPSELWISGRQSTTAFDFSEYQYMEVSGAMPRRATSWRMKTVLSTSMITDLAALHDETVGAGDAWSVEKGIDGYRVGAGFAASRNRRA